MLLPARDGSVEAAPARLVSGYEMGSRRLIYLDKFQTRREDVFFDARAQVTARFFLAAVDEINFLKRGQKSPYATALNIA